MKNLSVAVAELTLKFSTDPKEREEAEKLIARAEFKAKRRAMFIERARKCTK